VKVEVEVRMSLVGCEKKDIIEFEDGTSDEEIEEICKEWMFDQIEWNYRTIDDKPTVKKEA
jgi:hypothetical protein